MAEKQTSMSNPKPGAQIGSNADGKLPRFEIVPPDDSLPFADISTPSSIFETSFTQQISHSQAPENLNITTDLEHEGHLEESSDDDEGGFIIAENIQYTLHVKCMDHPPREREDKFRWNAQNSYHQIERMARQLAETASNGPDEAVSTLFRYGHCMILKRNREVKQRFALNSEEDWKFLVNTLLQEYSNGVLKKYRVVIYREYFKLRLQPDTADETPFPEAKDWELRWLMKTNIDNKEFIAQADLQKYTSDSMIRAIITHDPSWGTRPSETTCETLVQKIIQKKARKLLAICIYEHIGMKCLDKLIDMDYNDQRLPRRVGSCCKKHEKFGKKLFRHHEIFQVAEFTKPGEYQEISSWFTVPVIPIDAEMKDLAMSEISRGSIEAQDRPASESNSKKDQALIGEGSQGCVYRVRLDPQHHSLSKDPFIEFALKEFKKNDINFERESQMLQSLRSYSHTHLTTHFVTWSQGEKYYMLFPLAECNLHEYMRGTSFSHTPAKILWLLGEFRGLASALERIHDLTFRNEFVPKENLSPNRAQGQERRAGWHHDLKAENILFFKQSKTFQIADFGSSKIFNFRSRSNPTKTTEGTPTYEPPELGKEGTTSRPYDVWSLGCVYLELLVWAFFGFSAVERFKDDRLCKRAPDRHYEDDGFWQKHPDGLLLLRPSVSTWIDRLTIEAQQQQHEPFFELIDVIKNMLEIDRERRIESKDVSHDIDNICTRKAVDIGQSIDGSRPSSRASNSSSLFLNVRSSPSTWSRRPSVADSPTEEARIALRDYQLPSPTEALFPQSRLPQHRRNSSGYMNSEGILSRTGSVASGRSGQSPRSSRQEKSSSGTMPAVPSRTANLLSGAQHTSRHSAKSSIDETESEPK